MSPSMHQQDPSASASKPPQESEDLAHGFGPQASGARSLAALAMQAARAADQIARWDWSLKAAMGHEAVFDADRLFFAQATPQDLEWLRSSAKKLAGAQKNLDPNEAIAPKEWEAALASQVRASIERAKSQG